MASGADPGLGSPVCTGTISIRFEITSLTSAKSVAARAAGCRVRSRCIIFLFTIHPINILLRNYTSFISLYATHALIPFNGCAVKRGWRDPFVALRVFEVQRKPPSGTFLKCRARPDLWPVIQN